MQHTAANMPSSWFSLPIKPGNVLVGTFLGLTEATSVDSPLSGPMTLDSWISAAEGDPSGLWFLSWMSDLAFPSRSSGASLQASGWPTRSPSSATSAPARTGARSSAIPSGSSCGGQEAWLHAWPANPGEHQYTSVQNSNVPTLLIGGTLDFETPAQNATKELLPHLSNGHQVILSGLGHVDDFFSYEPSASTQLLTTFYATGQVDTSRYTPNKVSFTTSHADRDCQGHPWDNGRRRFVGSDLARGVGDPDPPPRRYRPQDGRMDPFGRSDRVRTRRMVPRRTVGTAVLVWPSQAVDDQLLAGVSIAVPIWLGVYAGWVRTDTPKAMRAKGIGAAGVGAVVGTVLGYHATSGQIALITTIIGAAVVSNLSLLVLDIWTERAASRGTAAPAVDPSEMEHLETEHLEPALQ